ncbi:MAG: alpha/beta hydrolase [Phycisphaerales bacterium]
MKNEKFKVIILLLGICTFVNAMEVQINIEYGKVVDESLLLDVYSPKAEGYFGGVIVVHGGGWSGGDKRADITSLFEPMTDVNLVCFSINYRLAPKNRWPAAYEDVISAVKWVKANSLKYKTDPNRIALMGYSAGGQLAMLAAIKAQKETDVKAAVGLAMPADLVLDSLRRGNISTYLMDLFGVQALDANSLQWIWDASPINYLRPGIMPVLLVHGTEDKSVPYQQSLNFKQRVEDVGGKCELITIKGAEHKIAEWGNYDKDYQKKIALWLGEQLKYRQESK